MQTLSSSGSRDDLSVASRVNELFLFFSLFRIVLLLRQVVYAFVACVNDV